MRQTSKAALLLAVLVSVMGCATAPKYVPFSYTGNKLIYPAIREAITTVVKGATFDNIDIFENKFFVKNIIVLDGINQRKFDLDIDASNGTVSYSLKNVQLFRSKERVWENNPVFLLFNPQTLYTQLNNVIAPILLDDEKYASSKKAALSDMIFVYYTLKSMNSISIKDFLKNELSSIVSTVTGTVFNVEEKNETIEGTEYKYRVHFSQSVSNVQGNKFLWDNESIGYFMYTNDDSVVRYNRGSNISVDVKVVDTDRIDGSGGKFLMKVVQAN